MSYSGPPGLSQSHPSLPARPPPVPGASKPTKFSSTFAPAGASFAAGPAPPLPSTTSYSAAPGYGPSAPPASYGVSQPPSSYAYAQAPVAGRGGYGAQQQQQQPASYGGGGGGGGGYAPGYAAAPQPQAAAYGAQYSAAPQIRNPFPAPGERGDDYDPEMAAQIAQWQSAYIPKEAGAADAAGKSAAAPAPNSAEPAADAAAADADDRKKTVYRQGGGKKWADESLTEWDPSHLRLFVGNLAGEVTDESLLKAFSRWRSVQKTKVVRDKRTTKSKGYGFVSFSDPDDFFQAAKEMNGKYIQSHPVVVRKATTEIKVAAVRDDRKGARGQHKKGGKSGKGGKGGDEGKHQDGYAPHLGPVHGGVQKPGQKTKGGLKLLG